MISPRAIAVDGIGYKPNVLAVLGFRWFDVTMTVSPSGLGALGGKKTHRHEKIEKITFRIKFNNQEKITEFVIKKSLAIHLIVRLMNFFKIKSKIITRAKEIKWN